MTANKKTENNNEKAKMTERAETAAMATKAAASGGAM